MILELTGDGVDVVRAASREPQWTRLAVEFETGAAPAPVVVRVRQDASDGGRRARVDNLGLVEAD